MTSPTKGYASQLVKPTSCLSVAVTRPTRAIVPSAVCVIAIRSLLLHVAVERSAEAEHDSGTALLRKREFTAPFESKPSFVGKRADPLNRDLLEAPRNGPVPSET